jgi:hypothetical protein
MKKATGGRGLWGQKRQKERKKEKYKKELFQVLYQLNVTVSPVPVALLSKT